MSENKPKPKTIEEHCAQPAGSFSKFIAQKKAHLKALETERRERIRACRETVMELSWAA
jgi:hypothetical protein